MTQGELFDDAAGRAAKDDGLNLVEFHNGCFVSAARVRAAEIAHREGKVTSDDLRKWAVAAKAAPRHRNAWGAIFRGPHWVVVGHTRSKLISNHARVIRIWKYQA